VSKGRSRWRRLLAVGDLRTPAAWGRLALRVSLAVALFGVLYVLVTFVQVWSMSHRDGAREADAVVVLGAAQYDGVPSAVLQGRLDHALELYEDGLVDHIVVTGGSQEGDRFTEATAAANYLIDHHDVPDEHIIREVQGTNTWESLAAAARVLRDRELTDVVLVTDGYHALRVRAIADELGLNAWVSPSRPGGTVPQLARETVAVSVGRIIGFRRMVNVDDRVRENGGLAAVGVVSCGPLLCDDPFRRLR
jgi:uncharacterized SAM-binding protein YcdF (DUF218 family)